MNLENGDIGTVPDIGSPPDVLPIDRIIPISEIEWRNMLKAVRNLPHNRGTILLMPFRQCIGKTSWTVSIVDLQEIKKTRVQSVQTLQQLLTEINGRFRACNHSTPFTIYRNPAKGIVTSFTIARWNKSPGKRHPEKTISTIQGSSAASAIDPLVAAADNQHPGDPLQNTIADTTLHNDPSQSDLSPEDWQKVELVIATHAHAWKWHKVIEAICKAKPHPVPLSILDHIAKECGNERKYVWGSPIDKLNLSLKQNGCACRIMKIPSERITNTKGKHNIYEGTVTLYRTDLTTVSTTST